MIKTFEKSSLLEAIKLALKHRLFVTGWELKNTLEGSIGFIEESLEDGEKINIHIALFFDKEIPVGIIFSNSSNKETQIFVKETYRRKGIATALSNQMHQIIKEPLNVYQGCENSQFFYHTLDFLVEHHF